MESQRDAACNHSSSISSDILRRPKTFEKQQQFFDINGDFFFKMLWPSLRISEIFLAICNFTKKLGSFFTLKSSAEKDEREKKYL